MSYIPTRQEIESQITTFGRINTYSFGKTNERKIRMVISELRKQGHILIPIEPREYVAVNHLKQEDIDDFLNRQTKHLITQYRNTIRPLKHLVKDMKLIELMGTLDMMEEEV
jgi:hypothetical protein